MTIAMIVAMGPNSVEVPCLWFEEVGAAKSYLNDLFGPADYHDRWHPASVVQLKSLADLFFTDYYDGCGGVWGFTVKEVEAGRPFVPFNLD